MNELYTQPLGLTPEDIGATQSVLVSRAVLVAVALVGFSGFLLMCMVGGGMIASALGERLMGSKKFVGLIGPRIGPRGEWPRRAAVVTLGMLVVSLAAGLGLAILLKNTLIGVDLAVVLGTFGFAAALAYRLAWEDMPPAGRVLDRKWRRGRVAVAIGFLLAAATWWTVVSLEAAGAEQARHVLKGDGGPDPQGLLALLVVADPSPARLVALGSEDPLGLCDGRKIPKYLASDGGQVIVVVYSELGSSAIGVFRVPSASYSTVTGLKRSEPCSVPPTRNAPKK